MMPQIHLVLEIPHRTGLLMGEKIPKGWIRTTNAWWEDEVGQALEFQQFQQMAVLNRMIWGSLIGFAAIRQFDELDAV